ncbi:MAG TPA: hypothetical protein VNK45_01385, partial [Candidatus Acidoferrales bacterium]|nr:hypothetical protein [Candidatus Acidoferrales bacterium]
MIQFDASLRYLHQSAASPADTAEFVCGSGREGCADDGAQVRGLTNPRQAIFLKGLSDRLLSQVRCRELFQGWMVRTMALSVESTLAHASDQGDLGQFAGAD